MCFPKCSVPLFRFPPNTPLGKNRYLQNVVLLSAEKHVGFGGGSSGVKPGALSIVVLCVPHTIPKIGDYFMTTQELIIRNNLSIDFSRETQLCQ